MLADTYANIRNLLKDDTTMQSLLGGEYVYVSYVSQTNQIPSVTILQNNENSTKRTCYNQFKERELSSTVQIDVWSECTVKETVDIANRIDALLMLTGVTNTWGWEKIQDSDTFEDDTRVYHKALRYTFMEKVTDS